MRFRSENIRIQKIAEVQRKLAQGIYDSADELERILDEVFEKTGPDSFISDLQNCPVGDGNQYRDLVYLTMLNSFGELIDRDLSHIEGAAGGGRMDIELPLRYRALHQEAIFADWNRRFRLKSLIVECKNQKGRASLADYRQLRDYLHTAGRGRVGALVARNGFAKTVSKRVSEDARGGSSLLLLIGEDELFDLARTDPYDVPEWLHRKEIKTLQAA